MSRPVSGNQYTLRHGRYEVHIASVGASLRRLTCAGRDLVVPFAPDEVRPSYHGAVLAPWPNRVVDGRYEFGGAAHRLALTEPERGHALHGLVSWLDFDLIEQADSGVALAAWVEAQAGYPWRVKVLVRYSVDDSGLRTEVSIRNESADPAPVGLSAHPYLVAGPGTVDDWTLELPAERYLAIDEEHLIPQGEMRVDAGDARFDFRSGRRISTTFIDHAFTRLVRDTEGMATIRLLGPDGHGVAMRWGSSCEWVQIHTADRRDAPEESRRGLAVEPMTCPPDAFNSGAGLDALPSGATTAAEWTTFAV